MSEITHDIQKNLGTLSESSKAWKKELNLISWNGREPKYDIRDWAPEYLKMGKGITLSKEELISLRDILNNLDL